MDGRPLLKSRSLALAFTSADTPGEGRRAKVRYIRGHREGVAAAPRT